MLELRNVRAGYSRTEVLFDLELKVPAGQFVTLLGRNGMGKTTAVRAIMGLLTPTHGDIVFNNAPIAGRASFQIARLGIGLVPEGRMVCGNLSVHENLIATQRQSGGRALWNIDAIYELFPPLRERRHHYGSQLSGGEQQLVAIGRALMTNPALLILDEATEGLAPLMRREVWRCLKILRERKQSVLLIDKHIDILGRLADYHYVIEKGRIVWEGNDRAFHVERQSFDRYLGVA